MIINIDYASIDKNQPPDWAALDKALKTTGSTVGSVIFRGSWGTLKDDTIQRDWKRAKDSGKICGAYLFLRSSQDPLAQVHAFAEAVGPLTGQDLIPSLDVEDNGWESADQELNDVHTAWTEMREIYGVPPMIYTSDRVWREDLHNLSPGEMLDSPLWVAKPWPWQVRSMARLQSSAFDNGNYKPIVPSPWGVGNWWLHQYQGDAVYMPGFSSTVDLSRWNLLREGEAGKRVLWVQARLGLEQTGIYSTAVVSAVKEFQAAHGLAKDGVIGPKTFVAIAWTKAGGVPRAADAPCTRGA